MKLSSFFFFFYKSNMPIANCKHQVPQLTLNDCGATKRLLDLKSIDVDIVVRVRRRGLKCAEAYYPDYG